MNITDLDNLQKIDSARFDLAELKLHDLMQETAKYRAITRHSRQWLQEIDDEFESRTSLNKTDYCFLIFAVGLQVARQYLLTSFPERLGDQEAAKKAKGGKKEHSNRPQRSGRAYYNPPLNEIITNPVPFDANVGSDGALTGGGILGHRATAIGHDPILGLIFGTANIATATLTTWDMQSYHITTTLGIKKQDCFGDNASTALVFKYFKEKLLDKGVEGKTIIVTSLMKEIIHLRSDINSKNSLPLPFISVIDPKLASVLAKYGFDASNLEVVGKQATFSIIINTVIGLIHGMFCNGTSEEERKLHEVKTRKILLYSNLIASVSNVLYVAISAYVGNPSAMKKLDVGGLAVTIFRLITDVNFIYKIKKEFVINHFEKMLTGEAIIDYNKYDIEPCFAKLGELN